MSELDKLIDAVERGDDDEVASLLRDMHKDANSAGDFWPSHDALKTYRGSIDAAKAVHDALTPGWDIQISTYEDDSFEASVSDPRCVKTYDGVSHWIARAWLLAVLKAVRAEGGKDE